MLPECRKCLDSCPVMAIHDKSVTQKKCRQNTYGKTARGFDTVDCNKCRREFPMIEFISKDNVVLHTWKKEAHFDDYRKSVEASLELLREHKDSIFIVDATNGFEDVVEDVEWGFT